MIPSVESYAANLLSFKKNTGESDEVFLKRLSSFLNLPNDIIKFEKKALNP